jgi:O-methyltransferase
MLFPAPALSVAIADTGVESTLAERFPKECTWNPRSPTTPLVQRDGIATPAVRLYLHLLKQCLIREIFPDQRYEDCDLSHKLPYSRELRESGLDWPTEAETMVGKRRLDSLQECCLAVIQEGVPGDFVETGTWRGGCGILMRAVLEATGEDQRKVWLFDSFKGLPKPDAEAFPTDEGDQHWTFSSYLGVSLENVKANFEKYGLLDDRIRFIEGWFRDTIPVSDVSPIAVLRLDGDMYESTWLVLNHFYPKVSSGGFIVIDDYGAIPACKAAVDDFRAAHSIASMIEPIDWTGVLWRKTEPHEANGTRTTGPLASVTWDMLQLQEKLQAEHAKYAATLADLRSALKERDTLQAKIEPTDAALHSLVAERDDLQARLERSAAEVAGCKQQLNVEHALRESIEASKSWRLTEPLRRIWAALRRSR